MTSLFQIAVCIVFGHKRPRTKFTVPVLDKKVLLSLLNLYWITIFKQGYIVLRRQLN
jgi:hypothetical protein